MKQLSLFLFFLISIAVQSQQENSLLERSFWQTQPDLDTVKQKIEDGNDATAFNSNAFDATVYAILAKTDARVVKYLLSLEGNSVNKKTHDSRIYLHWAAYAGQIDIVNYLLDKGASTAALDSHGNTPLMFATNAGQINPELYNAFEKHGVQLTNETNAHGANLLLLVAPSLSNQEELDFFLKKGFTLDTKDHDGNGIFNYATKKGNIDFLKLLVSKGADYKTLNSKGGNAFLFAVQGGRGYSNPIAVYEYLKSLGLDPNNVTIEGSTPLHRLAYNTTDPAILKLFLDAGADVNQKDAEGQTPFLNAASRNELKMVQLLAQDVNDFNATNNKGQNALMLAVKRNSPDVVKFLVDTQINTFAKDAEGNTLAFYLVESFNKRQPEVFDAKLQLLQAQDIKWNTIQANGETVYHLAVKNDAIEVLKKLEDATIDINAKNDEGLTALHLAAMKAENDELMKYLISQGADTKIKTDFEESAFDLASENELLQQHHTPLNFLK